MISKNSKCRVKITTNRQEKRDKFSRKRLECEDKEIDFINDRNKVFNKKLERSFAPYAAEIKANLERGSAV